MLVEVIKYDPSSREENNILFHRHEAEDFSCNAQLLVAPNQIALFVNEGEVVPYLPGHYTLDDSNNSAFKFIEKWRRKNSDGVSSYHCYVYFVNLVVLQNLKFGTQDPISVTDPLTGMLLDLRAAGTFGVHFDNDNKDAAGVIKFFLKVIGTQSEYTTKDLELYLRGEIIKYMKTWLGKAIIESKIPFFEISIHYVELSKALLSSISPIFKDYGVIIDNLAFTTINVPEEQIAFYRQKTQERAANVLEMQIKEQQSIQRAEQRAREGYSYQQERGFDVMKEAAGNEATAGQFMGAGMGLGMGFGVGGAVGGAFGSVARESFGSMNQAPQKQNTCPNCGKPVNEDAKFCPNCGKSMVPTCPQCGAEITLGAKFCPNCGKKLGNSCPSCGADLDINAKFCPNCGNKIS